MQTKLTLRLDAELIKKAKIYARQKNTSVSKLVEKYFSVWKNNATVIGTRFAARNSIAVGIARRYIDRRT